MKNQFKTIWTVCITTLVLCTTSIAHGQDMAWQTDFATAMKKAKAEDKMLLLHFTADWCRACKQLDTFVFNSQIVARDLQSTMVPVKVDVDLHPELADEYSVTKLPFDVVITTSGRVVTQRPSPKSISEYSNLGKNVIRMTTKIDEGSVSVAQSFAAIKEKLKPKNNPLLLDKNDFKPTTPSHTSPGAATDGLALTEKAESMADKVRKDMFFGQTPRPSQNTGAAKTTIANPHIGGDFQPTASKANSVKRETKPSVTDATPIKTTFDKSLFPVNQKTAGANSFQAISPNKSSAKIDASHEQVQHTSSESNLFPIKQAGAAPGTAADIAKKQDQPKPLTPVMFGSESTNKPTSNGSTITAQTLSEINQDTPTTKPNSVPAANLIQPKPFEPKQEQQQVATAKILKPQTSIGTFKTQPTQMLGPKTSGTAPQLLAPKTTVQVAPKKSFGLKGKCPVTLLTQSQWIDGDERFGCVHRGRTYIFASKIHLIEFQSDPDRYSPLLAGYDPVAFHENGALLDGDESLGVFMGTTPNQRIVLFANLEHKQRFQANPKIYIETIRQAMKSPSSQSRR